MSDSIEIRLFDQDRLLFSDEFGEPVELGRQSDARENLYVKRLQGDQWRSRGSPAWPRKRCRGSIF